MAISRVGETYAEGTATCSPHGSALDDDIAIAFLWRRSGPTPGTPSGWTSVMSNARPLNVMTLRIVRRVLDGTSDDDITGEATTSRIVMHVLRGQGSSPIGASAAEDNNTGTTVEIPGLTLAVTDGTSWVVAGALDTSGDIHADTASGLTNRSSGFSGGSQPYAGDTNGPVASFAATSVEQGASGTWMGAAVEILEGVPGGVPDTAELYFKTGLGDTDWVRVDDGGTGGDGWTTVPATADESVTNNTLQNDDHLFFTAAAGIIYEYEALVIYSNAAGGTPDIKFAFGEDGTNRGHTQLVGYSTADGNQNLNVINDQAASAAFGGAAVKRFAWIRGFHYGNGGTFRVLWAQNTTNATATVRHEGSVLRYRELAVA